MNTPRIPRRAFLKTATAFAGGAGLPVWFAEETLSAAAPAAGGPNDRLNVALIGCGGQGRYDAKLALPFANIVAVCDVDSGRAAAASKQFGDAKVYKNYRDVLARSDISAVINGTPDHWHTFINMAAMSAGKDVYSEKPLTLTIDEGKRLVALARRRKRILQTGSHQRSDPRFRLACELVQNGRLGTLKQVATVLPAGMRGGPFARAAIPAELDWNQWQGQAPATAYVPERCHQKFRYWLDYSGGTMTDWGAHHNDIALWGMGMERSGPLTIEGRALVEMIPGGYNAPSEYEITYTYANGVTQTCRSTSRNRTDGSVAPDARGEEPQHGVRFEGENGWIFVTRGKIEASKPELLTTPLTVKKYPLYVSNDHMKNFFDCIRSRQQPVCEVEIGHRAVSVCHLGIIAIRLGRKLTWNARKEEFAGDKEANALLAREHRAPFSYDTI